MELATNAVRPPINRTSHFPLYHYQYTVASGLAIGALHHSVRQTSQKCSMLPPELETSLC